MPTCAELAKRIDELESAFNAKLSGVLKEIEAQIKLKCCDLGLDESANVLQSIDFMGKKFDELSAKQNELVAANKVLMAQNETLNKKVADLEQHSRKNNVEIKGVPSTQNEDCSAILKRMGDVVRCPVSTTDIDTIHRVPSKSGEKAIIARFVCRDKRDDFVRKARKARLRANQIGFSGSTDSAIYVNDHLTIENKMLFSKALALKKERRWQYLWTENCQIKARQTSDSRQFRISSESDLRIFG